MPKTDPSNKMPKTTIESKMKERKANKQKRPSHHVGRNFLHSENTKSKKRSRTYSNSIIAHSKGFYHKFPHLPNSVLVFIIIRAIIRYFVPEKPTNREPQKSKIVRRSKQEEGEIKRENVEYACEKALRKWKSWEIQWRNASESNFPEAKHTKKGVYMATTESFRNLIQNFLAMPSSSTTPPILKRSRFQWWTITTRFESNRVSQEKKCLRWWWWWWWSSERNKREKSNREREWKWVGEWIVVYVWFILVQFCGKMRESFERGGGRERRRERGRRSTWIMEASWVQRVWWPAQPVARVARVFTFNY